MSPLTHLHCYQPRYSSPGSLATFTVQPVRISRVKAYLLKSFHHSTHASFMHCVMTSDISSKIAILAGQPLDFLRQGGLWCLCTTSTTYGLVHKQEPRLRKWSGILSQTHIEKRGRNNRDQSFRQTLNLQAREALLFLLRVAVADVISLLMHRGPRKTGFNEPEFSSSQHGGSSSDNLLLALQGSQRYSLSHGSVGLPISRPFINYNQGIAIATVLLTIQRPPEDPSIDTPSSGSFVNLSGSFASNNQSAKIKPFTFL